MWSVTCDVTLSSPHLTSPHLTSPHLSSPHLTSPHLTSPLLTSPHLRLPGSEGLLRGLTAFEPRRRWNVREAMQSELFEPYRCEQPPTRAPRDGATLSQSDSKGYTLSYLAYLDDPTA